ncbi:unnamed protein product [Parascedosporium putredinis]|uniref:Uncharacterized protein n=1 Tax=Parascedosporium putredinis TaxID=1442378 RepID=A0A9P1M7D2_9PEZI|nr:unnamed protein product [Parascedosporium putredinis]CAI7988212.1 unnamed protein product [Parascedosporium putredinis]
MLQASERFEDLGLAKSLLANEYCVTRLTRKAFAPTWDRYFDCPKREDVSDPTSLVDPDDDRWDVYHAQNLLMEQPFFTIHLILKAQQAWFDETRPPSKAETIHWRTCRVPNVDCNEHCRAGSAHEFNAAACFEHDYQAAKGVFGLEQLAGVSIGAAKTLSQASQCRRNLDDTRHCVALYDAYDFYLQCKDMAEDEPGFWAMAELCDRLRNTFDGDDPRALRIMRRDAGRDPNNSDLEYDPENDSDVDADFEGDANLERIRKEVRHERMLAACEREDVDGEDEDEEEEDEGGLEGPKYHDIVGGTVDMGI